MKLLALFIGFSAAQFCTLDVHICPDGSAVSRDPENDCKFKECPLVDCTEDALQCDDGTVVVRDPKRNCNFPECAPHTKPPTTTKPTPSPTTKKPQPTPQSTPAATSPVPTDSQSTDTQTTEAPSSDDIVCPMDVKECDDGSQLSRDPQNDCKFASCDEDLDSSARIITTTSIIINLFVVTCMFFV